MLTITELLRKHGVVGKFVEFYGDGVAAVPLANRATIGNMSPEYGSTCAIFPIDDETLRYLRLTGRADEQVALVEAYAKEQGLWHDPAHEAALLRVPRARPVHRGALASPARSGPQDRIAVSRGQGSLPRRADATTSAHDGVPSTAVGRGLGRVLPGQRRPGLGPGDDSGTRAARGRPTPGPSAAQPPTPVRARPTARDRDRPRRRRDRGDHLVHQHLQPVGDDRRGAAGKKAVERGLTRKPWVKTTLAPGSKVVMDYYDQAGLTPYLEKLGFDLVGYGCTTCIGNSGPLPEEICAAVNAADLAVVSVLSGNRNFEGRINPDVKMNYLASPPLVVAYALAGTMDVDLDTEPLGTGPDGQPVYLRDIWPSPHEVEQVDRPSAISPEMFTSRYADVFAGDERVAVAADARPATPSSGTPTRPTCASRRTSRACRRAGAGRPTSPAPGCSPCSATR